MVVKAARNVKLHDDGSPQLDYWDTQVGEGSEDVVGWSRELSTDDKHVELGDAQRTEGSPARIELWLTPTASTNSKAGVGALCGRECGLASPKFKKISPKF